MNITTVTIPQLFYDFIARVIPGFIFSFLLGLMFPSILETKSFEIINSEDWMGSFFRGTGYFIICYVIGWLLLTFKSGSGPKYPEEGDNKIKQKFYELRHRDKEAAFLVLKLRAEARMLEGLKWGMIYLLTISVILAVIVIIQESLGEGSLDLLKIIPIIILLFLFRKSEGKAWKRYWRSVEMHHDIIFSNKKQEK